MIGSELRNLILKIRNERKNKGNTKGRVADTFDGMMAFVDSKFIRNSSESLTILGTPTLTDNTLHLKYTGENGVEQTVSADLSGLTPEVILPTKTSEFQNDGSDGVNPFITAQDIPEESLTSIQQPVLVGNILTIKYIGENGTLQEQSVDLSHLATIDIHIEDASYNAAANILTITDTEGFEYSVDLSEFSILTSTDAQGITTLTQEGVNKLIVSKVGQTGSYNDLLDKPNILTPADISGKLDKPSQDGSWVVTKSGAIISYTDASNFGKNIGNSHITSIANSSFTLGANYTINTSGYFFNITNLPDKSSDITFQEMLVQNSSGQVARGNGKFLAKTMPSLLTNAEKTIWKTEMNGGWTTNTMSIALISPIVIQKIDTIQYVTLLGANLNLNPTNFSVEIVNDTEVVIASIPGSQVQLQSNGLSLIFYYNFKDLPLGSYKIRLWNGVAYYVSQISFQVLSASNIYEVDQSLISWTFDFLTKAEGGSYNDHITSSGSIELGSMVKNSANVTYSNTATTLVASALSSELIVGGVPLTLNDNFYIELEFVGNHIASCHQGGISKDSTASLLSSFIASTKFIYAQWWALLPSSQNIGVQGTVPTKLIIAKTGNLLTLVMSSSGGTRITSVTVSSSSPVRLRLNKYLFDNKPTYKTTMNLISAYKF